MSQIELFLPAVRQGISGPLAMMMREALLRAAIRFCRESLISRETLTFGSLPAGEIVVLTPAEPERIMSRLLSATACINAQKAALWPGDDFSLLAESRLRLDRAVDRLWIRIATESSATAVTLPSVLLVYQDALAAGALMQLYMMPDKPWSDVQRADYYRIRFIEGYREAFRSSSEAAPDETGFHNPPRRHAFF